MHLHAPPESLGDACATILGSVCSAVATEQVALTSSTHWWGLIAAVFRVFLLRLSSLFRFLRVLVFVLSHWRRHNNFRQRSIVSHLVHFSSWMVRISTYHPLMLTMLTMLGLVTLVLRIIWHLTPSLFSSYTTSPQKTHITVANGSYIPAIGRDNIQLQPSLQLNNVLHVSNLSHNLLSIPKLTEDLNCTVTFFHTHCVF